MVIFRRFDRLFVEAFCPFCGTFSRFQGNFSRRFS